MQPLRDLDTAVAWDELLADAVPLVARALDDAANPAVGETAHLQPTVRTTLTGLLDGRDGWIVDEHEKTLPLGGWHPRPGPLDIGVRRIGDELPRCAIELKLRELHWTLWDFYKMVDALRLSGIERAYLVVGSTLRDWNSESPHRCLELFAPDGLDTPSTDLFERNTLAWQDLLEGGSGRPTSIPSRVTAEPIAAAPLQIDGQRGELRCIAVGNGGGEDLAFSPEWFCGDWPHGVNAPPEYVAWRRPRWALASALADAGGAMPTERATVAAKDLGLSLDTYGRHYRGELIFRRRGSDVELTAEGRSFVDDWRSTFGGTDRVA